MNKTLIAAALVSAGLTSGAHAAVVADVTDTNNTALSINATYSYFKPPGSSGNFPQNPSGTSIDLVYTDALTAFGQRVSPPTAKYSAEVDTSLSNTLLGTGTWKATGSVSSVITTDCVGAACSGGASTAESTVSTDWGTTFTIDAVTAYTLDYTFFANLTGSGNTSLTIDFQDANTFTDVDGFTPVSETATGFAAFMGTLQPGTYNITASLFGFANGVSGSGGTFTGSSLVNLQLGSPVPLPGAAWLLISGIGALGATVRRRKQAALAA